MTDILNWCRENKCGNYPHKCLGTTHPALCPEITGSDSSIIQELKDEHGISIVVLRCPCACDANSPDGNPKKDCPYCYGEGRIQYGIDEVEFK